MSCLNALHVGVYFYVFIYLFIYLFFGGGGGFCYMKKKSDRYDYFN